MFSRTSIFRCRWIIDKNNKPRILNENDKIRLTKEIIEKMAVDGLRTICIAYRDFSSEPENWDDEENIVKDLICIGIVGIEDPVRREARRVYRFPSRPDWLR